MQSPWGDPGPPWVLQETRYFNKNFPPLEGIGYTSMGKHRFCFLVGVYDDNHPDKGVWCRLVEDKEQWKLYAYGDVRCEAACFD